MSKLTNPATGGNDSPSRRTVLEHLGAGALVATPGVELPDGDLVETADSADTVRIATVKRGNEVLEWKEVPKVWHDHLQHARTVRKDVTQQFGSLNGVTAVLLARSDATYGGKNGFVIEVEVDSARGSVGLPEAVDGVAIRRTEAPEVEFANTCCHHTDYPRVPGGGASETGGSAGYCVENSNGNRRLLTANHIWGVCEDNTGAQFDQHSATFGTVDAVDEDTDYALVEPTGSDGIDDRVLVNGLRYAVSGYKTRDGICDLVASGETCYQTGGTTCTTDGPLTGCGSIDPVQCVDFEDHGFKADIYAGEGDSGGPFVDLVELNGDQFAALIGHLSFVATDSTECCHWGCGRTGAPSHGAAFYNLRDSPHNLSLC